MTTRLHSLRRGKTGDVQSFSKARPADNAITGLIKSTLGGVNPTLRTQVLSDPGNVCQFACVFGDCIGFYTRPILVADPVVPGGLMVLGNFTDTIGEPLPLAVTVQEFQGHFTTLVPLGDAELFDLAIHEMRPDVVEGPTARGNRLAATMERLNFPMPDNPAGGDYPVVVALPRFLPIGPGQTFPHLLAIDDATSFYGTFPLFEVWRRGLRYARQHNNGHSVTLGGTMFHLPSFEIAQGDDDPFEHFEILPETPRHLNALLPTSALYPQGREQLLSFSDVIWVELGSSLEPEPAAANAGGGGGNFTPEHFRAVLAPLVPKDKVFAQAGRTAARYRLFLASAPPTGSDQPEIAVLPVLREGFSAYLSIPSSATAGDELREQFKSRLSVSNSSHLSVDKDVTLEPENITLAFSDRVRIFCWLSEKLVSTSHPGAKATLGLLQFLTPDRVALAVVAEGDLEAATLLMSNSSSSTAQLDASKSSQLYCDGRLSSFRHSYEAFCNFRCFVSVLVEDLQAPLLLQKMFEYSSLLVDRQGRLFFDAHERSPHLPVHPWQDLQSIVSAFCRISTDSTLYGAVISGQPVAISNYKAAIDVADALISDLRAILNGNGLGKFSGVPSCAPWFPSARIVTPPRGTSGTAAGSDAKRQKTQDPPRDSADAERKKSFGLLEFDSSAAGATRLPTANVYFKKRGAKNPERLCMRFLTRGFSCDSTNCKLPHITQLTVLPSVDQTKLIEFVRKQPGLSWVSGKGPAGTS